MLCPYCNEEIKDGAKKCRFCGEFLDGRETQKEVVVQQPKKKKWLSWMEWALIIVVILAFIWFFSTSDTAKNDVGNISNDYAPTTTVKSYSSLNDAYNDHKNYIRHVCQEWLKLISSNQEHDFEWPTYAGEYQGKFIVKWTDHWELFRCEFIPYENEWGMNLNDVKRE